MAEQRNGVGDVRFRGWDFSSQVALSGLEAVAARWYDKRGNASEHRVAEQVDLKYDVALSFLYADVLLAGEIADRIGEVLTVFFFPKRQDVLAGTNGMETMRLPFYSQARLNVVLYRDGWGCTPWTRVEATAIQERCLNDGWKTLFFVCVDGAEVFPAWLPETHVRFDLRHFSLEEAIGAIKLRVVENGGSVRQLTALDRAVIARRESERIEHQKTSFNSHHWIANCAEPQVASIIRHLIVLSNRLSSEVGILNRYGYNKTLFVMTTGQFSASLSWQMHYTNEMGKIMVATYIGEVLLPGGSGMYLDGPPPRLEEFHFAPELSIDGRLSWNNASRGKLGLTAEDVAEFTIESFISVYERITKGKLKPDEIIHARMFRR